MDGLKERLRALRESRGYSQKGLAKRLGCSPSLISSYETGERSPSLQNLIALAAGLTKADFLLCNDQGYALLTSDQRLGGQVVSVPQEIHRAHRGTAGGGGGDRPGHAPAE